MWSEQQFITEWTRINDIHETEQHRVEGRHDQRVAAMFRQCGWTQQQIADKVGLSRQHVQRLLLYGQFMAFTENAPTGANFKIPGNFTERQFRGYWEQTDKTQSKDERRFTEVIRMMQENDDVADQPKTRCGKIISACGDGKFHTVERIAEVCGFTTEEVKLSLRYMKGRPSVAHVSTNGAKTSPKYKIKKGSGKRIDLAVVLDELEPLLKELEAEGKKTHLAHYCPSVVLTLTHRIRRLLSERAK